MKYQSVLVTIFSMHFAATKKIQLAPAEPLDCIYKAYLHETAAKPSENIEHLS